MQIVLQAGALGLLALIVYQLPKLFNSLQEWKRSSEKDHREERDSLKKERDAAMAAFREEIRYERQECANHFDRLAMMGHDNHQATAKALDKLGEAIRAVGSAVVTHDEMARTAINMAQKKKEETPPDDKSK